MRAVSAVAVLVLVAAACLSVASCGKQTQTSSDTEVVATPAPTEEPPAPAGDTEQPSEPAGDAEETTATGGDPTQVVDEVGAPVFEGATAGTVETEGDTRRAIYLTDAEYDDVRDFYLAELKEPDWTNNGFEAGPFGGDTWEFKNADGSKLVTIDSESDAANTEITFTVRPAEE